MFNLLAFIKFPRKILFIATCGFGVFVSSDRALSQIPSNIIPDDTLGSEKSTLLQDNNLTGIGGGAVRGDNLFHSFQEFNVGEGQGVYFFPANNIQNILTRVTGNNPSEILGTLGTFGGANPNLFLLNPNGIVFGENASLDLSGSFTATTANAVILGESGVFSASNPVSSNLLAVNPSALLFNAIQNQAGITNYSSATIPALEIFLNGEPFRENSGLQVINGNLFLVGGNVVLDSGTLGVSGGNVEVGGLADSGIVSLGESLGFPEGVSRADVILQNTAGIGAIAGGNISLFARNLSLENSGIGAGINRIDTPQGGNITLNVTDTTTLNQSLLANAVGENAVGNGGDIRIQTGSFVSQDSVFLSGTAGMGNGGRVIIAATDEVTFDNSGILAGVLQNGEGSSGDILISARSLSIRNGTRLVAGTEGIGNAGTLSIQVQEGLTLEDSQLVNSVGETGVGNAGNMNISARSLLANNTQLVAGTASQGNAGNISLQTSEDTVLNNSTIFDGVTEGGVGDAGNIEIQARSLFFNGTQMASATQGQGNAGNILLRGEEKVILQNSEIGNSVLRGEDGTFGIGDGGELNIQARSLLLDNSRLGASTAGQGNAGTVILKAQEDIVFHQSSLGNGIEAGGIGQGGEINLQANSLTLTHGTAIVSGTGGEGDAGKITITVNDAVSVNASVITNNVALNGIGNGGEISIQADSILLEDGALLLAGTVGNGDAGRIQLQATDFILIDGYSLVDNPILETRAGTSSGLVAGTLESATGKGGEVEIESDRVTISNGAIVAAGTTNSQSGGNVLITTNTLNLLEGGQIVTASEGSGNAGIITVQANNITVANFDPTFEERQASLTEDAFIGSEAASGLFANTLEDSTGDGGSINIDTINLSLLNTGRVSAKTDGTGNAGGLTLHAAGRVYVNDGNLNASAVAGKAGSLQIQANEIELRNGSLMSVTTPSEGGVIFSNSNVFLALEDSDILANTTVGGDIAINSPVFIADIFANQGLGITTQVPEDFDSLRGNGRVDIISRTGNVTAPDFSFLEDALVELSGNFVSPDTVVAGSCLARRNVAQGSFTVTGTGGLPVTPDSDIDGWYGMLEEETNLPVSQQQPLSHSDSNSEQWKLGDPIREAQGIVKTADGRQLLGFAPSSLMASSALICD